MRCFLRIKKTASKKMKAASVLLMAAVILLCVIAGLPTLGEKSVYAASAQDIRIGDYIENFGGFKWRVIGKDENGLLVRTDRVEVNLQFSIGISNYINSAVMVSGHASSSNRTILGTNYWQQTQLRSFLNDTIYNRFNTTEKEVIAQVPQKQILWWGDAVAVNPNDANNSVISHTAAAGAEGSAVFTGYSNAVEDSQHNYNADVFRYTINDKIFIPDIKQVYESSLSDMKNANGGPYHVVLDASGAAVKAWTRTPYAADATGTGVRYVNTDGEIGSDDANTTKAITPALFIRFSASFASFRDSSAASGEQAGYRVYSDIAQTVTLDYSVQGGNGALEASVAGSSLPSGGSIHAGAFVVLKAVPNAGYRVKQWRLNNAIVEGNTAETFTLNIAQDSVVTVEFESDIFTVEFAVRGGNGTLSAARGSDSFSGGVVLKSSIIVFTASPEGHYRVKSWRVNGITVSGNTSLSYTLTVTQNAVVEVEFERKEQLPFLQEPPDLVYNASEQTPKITDDLRYSVIVSSKISAGNYTATVKLSDPARYEWENGSAGDVVINWKIVKAQRSNTVSISNWTYGGSPGVPTVSAVPDGALVKYYYDSNTAGLFESTQLPVNAGVYYIKAHIEAGENYYEFTTAAVRFTVSKASLTVTAENKEKIYGSTNPELTVTMDGLADGDEFTFIAQTTADKNSNAGIYAITVIEQTLENYNVNYISGTLTVYAALLEKPVASGQILFTYNGGLHGFDGSYLTGFDSDVMKLEGSEALNAGVYTATVVLVSTYNYGWIDGGTVSVEWEIIKAELTVTADNASRQYNTSNPEFTYSATGFLGKDTAAVIFGKFDFSTDANITDPVGTYGIFIGKGTAEADNYFFKFEEGILTVTLRILAKPVAKSATEFIYNGNTQTFELSGFDSLTMRVDGNSRKNAGNYTAVVTLNDTDNYAWQSGGNSAVEIEWEITKAPLTVTAFDRQKVYGEQNPAFTVMVTGLLGGDSITFTAAAETDEDTDVGVYAITIARQTLDNYDVSYTDALLTVTVKLLAKPQLSGQSSFVYNSSSRTLALSGFDSLTMSVTGHTAVVAGDYKASITLNDTNNYAWLGGGNGAVEIEWKITKAPLTVTVQNEQKIYGGQNPEFTVTVSGLLGSDSFTFTAETDADENSSVGVYAVIIERQTLANYNVSYLDGTLTVTVKLLAKPQLSGQSSFVYNGNSQTVELSGFDNLTMTVSMQSGKNAADYTVVISLKNTANYNWIGGGSGSVEIEWKITKAPLTVTADSKTKKYGEANPLFSVSYSGFLPGDNASNSVKGAFSLYSPADEKSAVGGYVITAEDGAASAVNYSFVFEDGTLTVTRAELIIRLRSEKGYIPDIFWTNSVWTQAGVVTGLKNGEILYGTLSTDNSDAKTYKDSGGAIGDFSWSGFDIKNSEGGSTADNYTVKYDLIVTIQEGIINFSGYGYNGVYDGLPHTIVVEADASINPQILYRGSGGDYTELNAPTYTNAGSYTVYYKITAENYEDKEGSNTVIITKAELKVAVENKTVTYGGSVPQYTAEVTGLIGGDSFGTFFLTCTYAQGSNAGEYGIEASGSTEIDNYTVTYINGTLTVEKVKIEIPTVGAAEFTYNGQSKEFEIDLSDYYTVTDNEQTNAGNYFAQVRIDDTDNYVWSDGSDAALVYAWKILKADRKNTVMVTGWTYGDSPNSPNAGTVPDGANTVFYYDTKANGAFTQTVRPVNAGEYFVRAVIAEGNNYNAYTTQAVSFIIEKAQLTVTADDKQKIYGQDNPALTVTVSGLKNGDGFVFTAQTSAGKWADADEYEVTVVEQTLENYKVIFNSGTLTVTPQLLTKPTAASAAVYIYSGGSQTIEINGFDDSLMSITGQTATAVAKHTAVITLKNTNNYNWLDESVAAVEIKWEITKAKLTVTAQDKQKVYGEQNPAFTVIVSGLLGSDSFKFTATAEADESTQIGGYAITIIRQTLANYDVVYLDGTLTITKLIVSKPVLSTINFTYNGKSQGPEIKQSNYYEATDNKKTDAGNYLAVVTLNDTENYAWEDGTNGALNFSWRILKANRQENSVNISGWTYGGLPDTPELAAAVDAEVKYYYDNSLAGAFTSLLAPGSAGTHYVRAVIAGGVNYNDYTTAAKEFLIDKAPLTVKANNKQRAYGAQNPFFDVSYSGFVDDDTAANSITGSFKFSTVADAVSFVGKYGITVSEGNARSSNYSFNFEAGTLTVIPAADIAIPSLVQNSFVYNAYTQRPQLLNFYDGKAEVTGGSDIAMKNVGSYSITVTLKDKQNTAWIDGTTRDIVLFWGITPATLTVTAQSAGRAYNAANPALSYVVTGFLGADIKAVSGAFEISTVATAISPVGDYKVVISKGTANAENYIFDFAYGTLTVFRAAVNKPSVTSSDFIYDGNEKRPSVETSGLYSFSGEIKGTDANLYKMVVALTDKTNCEWSDGTQTDLIVEWKILKAGRANTVTLSGWVYGTTDTDKLPRPGVGTVREGAAVTYYYDTSVDGDFTSTVVPVNPGTYYIRADISETTNYKQYSTPVASFMIAAVYSIQYKELFGTVHDNPVSYHIWSAVIILLSPSERKGYTFAGWFDNEQLSGQAVSQIESGSTGDRTLWAKWTLNSYTVVFSAGAGIDPVRITADAFSKVERPADPVREGYEFIGWYNGSSEWNFEKDTVTGDLSLTARWLKIEKNNSLLWLLSIPVAIALFGGGYIWIDALIKKKKKNT